jgi:proline iminopeptidase
MLALLFSLEFPKSVSGVLLRGTWLLRTKDISWCYRGGMGHFYPEEWAKFAKHVGCSEDEFGASGKGCGGGDTVAAYSKLIHGDEYAGPPDSETAAAAAAAWMAWDSTCGQLVPDPPSQTPPDPEFDMVAARIGVHWYADSVNWWSDEHILEKAASGVLKGVPVSLVNGRYDLLCPPKWTHETAQALTEGGADCTVDYV